MNNIERITLAEAHPIEDSNILRQYAVQKASWLWHPDVVQQVPSQVVFRNNFTLHTPEETLLHVSADMRYELYLDDELISVGPDRCDASHWSFASYKIALSEGEHRLEAKVWWLGDKAPVAQISVQNGFILAVEGHLEQQLDTGCGAWSVAEERGWSYDRTYAYQDYHVVGPAWQVDGRERYKNALVWVKPNVIQGPLVSNDTGVIMNGWQLFPSKLPDQYNKVCSPGAIRAVAMRDTLGTITEKDISHVAVKEWQGVLAGEGITIPAHTSCHVIWDLEDYFCGYEQCRCSGGRNSTLSLEWAESMFIYEDAVEECRWKGNRDELTDKIFVGFGLHIVADGGKKRTYRAPWWHSGRYLLLTIKTAEEQLHMHEIAFRETRYPLENESRFVSSDDAMDAIIPLAVRGIQMCSHDTFVDCPYYEQMMYVGDTRLQMLVTTSMTSDTRLVKRGLELFDWSRYKTGVVAERYPANEFQISYTFACIWTLMIYDFALWHDDAPWIKERLVGVRSQMLYLRNKRDAQGLLAGLPGWSFVDWTSDWVNGRPPAVSQKQPSAIINLQYVYALRAAAYLEEHFGEPELAQLWYRDADESSNSIRNIFWQEEHQLFSDDPAGTLFSEHAQCLATIIGIWRHDAGKREACFEAMLAKKDITRTTIYYSYYLFECFYLFKRGDLIQKRLDEWKGLLNNGFKTPVETPEPSRSDCHAWGSHPLWHMHASCAGIRPTSPGFKTVRIAPEPGSLEKLATKTLHPQGMIITNMTFIQNTCAATVTLPTGVDGIFLWRGKMQELAAGVTTKINL